MTRPEDDMGGHPLAQLGLTLDHVEQLPAGLRSRLLNFLLRWEQYQAALDCLAIWIPLKPKHVSLRDAQARALLGLGEASAALEALRLRQEQRTSLSSRALEARILLALGDSDQALTIAQELLTKDQSKPSVWNLLGDIYLARRDYPAALAAYTHLGRRWPNSRAYLLGLLSLYQAQGDQVTASGYAVRLERSAVEGASLPAYILRRLRDYYHASGEQNRATDQEAALESLYRQDFSALRAALAAFAPCKVRAEKTEQTAQDRFVPDEGSRPTASTITVLAEERQRIEQAAKRFFGFESLLPGQAEAIAAVLRGQDVLAILPTGGGKSLCYQLPAFLDQTGVTLVISPLIALMKDQVDSLPAALRAQATTIHSALDGDELRQRLRRVAAGHYRLVYAAPERLRQPPFLHALRRAGVCRLVIDEAHCVSIWGHDFRPDYLYIGQAREMLGHPPLLAMTATAPPRVRHDIIQRIGAPGTPNEMAIVTAEIYRPNLYLETIKVKHAREKLDHLLALCQAETGSGIVYVNSRERSERLAALLREQGIAAGHYHAGMGDGTVRAAAQDAFMRGEVRVMVATVAFGMGIDKADIRFILHYNLPSSLEAYYQEVGRAGRDGLPARCVLLYSPGERATLTNRAKWDIPSLEDLRTVYRAVKRRLAGASMGRVALGDLQRDLAAEETSVRVALSLLEEAGLLRRHCDLPRTAVVELLPGHPSQPSPPNEAALQRFIAAARLQPEDPLPLDLLAVAQAAGLPVADIEEQVLAWADGGWLHYRAAGRDLLLEVWPPPADISIRVQTLLDRYATIAAQRIDEVSAYAKTSRCRHGHISSYLGGQGLARCTSCDNCRTSQPPTTAEHPVEDAATGTLDLVLFEALRLWRRQVAQEANVPPYVVAHDSLLRQLATLKPQNEHELAHIKGVGPRKLARYGTAILDIIRRNGHPE